MDENEKQLIGLERSFETLKVIMECANKTPCRVFLRDLRKAWLSLERQFWAYHLRLEERIGEKQNE